MVSDDEGRVFGSDGRQITLINPEWWWRIRRLDGAVLYVRLSQNVVPVKIVDVPMQVRGDFFAGTPDGEPAMTRHYQTLASARAVLTERGFTFRGVDTASRLF